MKRNLWKPAKELRMMIEESVPAEEKVKKEKKDEQFILSYLLSTEFLKAKRKQDKKKE